jgi:hypothetical protein
VADAAVAERQEVLRHQVPALDVVEDHVVGVEIGVMPEQLDKGGSGAPQQFDVAAVRLHRRQQDAIDLARLQHLEAAQGLLLRIPGIGEQHAVVCCVRRLLDAVQDVRIHGAGARDHHAERFRPAGHQRAGDGAGRVVQPLGGRQHLGPLLRAEFALAIQRPRGGGDGNAGLTGDFPNRDTHASSFTLSTQNLPHRSRLRMPARS